MPPSSDRVPESTENAKCKGVPFPSAPTLDGAGSQELNLSSKNKSQHVGVNLGVWTPLQQPLGIALKWARAVGMDARPRRPLFWERGGQSAQPRVGASVHTPLRGTWAPRRLDSGSQVSKSRSAPPAAGS